MLDLKRSLVDPEGDFVRIDGMPMDTSATVMVTEDELARIKNSSYDDEYDDDYDDDEYDEYDDDGYDDEYEDDEYDDDYDDDGAQDEDVNPRMAKVMKILMIVVAVIIASIAIFLIGKAAGVFKFGPGTAITDTKSEKVEVPNVVGMDEDEAIKALNKAGLGYKITARKESDKYEKGEVMQQSPVGGKKAKKNSQIELVISSGKKAEEVSVPDVTGKSESDAQKILEDAGFVVKSEATYSDDVDEGDVISTDPVASRHGLKRRRYRDDESQHGCRESGSPEPDW